MTTLPRSEHFFRRLLHGGGALIVWALHFFGAYVLVATACCTAFAETSWFGTPALRISLWWFSALAMLVIVALLVRGLRLPPGLLRSAGVGSGVLALIGVLWTTLPTVWALPLCLCR